MVKEFKKQRKRDNWRMTRTYLQWCLTEEMYAVSSYIPHNKHAHGRLNFTRDTSRTRNINISNDWVHFFRIFSSENHRTTTTVRNCPERTDAPSIIEIFPARCVQISTIEAARASCRYRVHRTPWAPISNLSFGNKLNSLTPNTNI